MATIDNKWTSDELMYEFQVRLEENLGIICGDAQPTPEQWAVAMVSADEACETLKGQQ
jgi:hypothetical protein